MEDLRKLPSYQMPAIQRFVVCFLLTSLLSSPTWAEEGLVEPYVVFTAHEEIYARCGPSGEYYRTDPLRLGQELDVYLETDDGWLGVRPPEGSFSWVPATSIEPDADGKTGTVVDKRAVAWIGTHLGRARKYRWQVQLAEGERVSILGETQRDSANGPELWYRIVPPSGEFRWVHRSQIAESSEELVQMHRRIDDSRLSQARDDDREPEVASEKAEDKQPAEIAKREPQRDADEVARTQPAERPSEQPAVDPQPITQPEPVGSGVSRAAFIQPKMTVSNSVSVHDIDGRRTAVPPQPDLPADDQSWVSGARGAIQPTRGAIQPTRGAIQPTRGATLPTPATSAVRGTIDDDQNAVFAELRETAPPHLQAVDYQSDARNQQMTIQLAQRVATADVDELQLELSRQMAAGAAASVVEPIRRRAATWIEMLTDPVERGRARVLQERVEQYQRISRRRDGQPPVDTSSVPVPTTTPASSLPATARPFDKEGFLVQVFSARPDSPPFALTNEAGQTLAYVSPAPGVNLRMHLNAKVGLHGEMSYLTGLETPHFIAKQAVRISR